MSAQSFRIFISSPGDVGREREVAYRVIERVEAWFGGRVKLEGYFWEHEPMRTTRGNFQVMPHPGLRRIECDSRSERAFADAA